MNTGTYRWQLSYPTINNIKIQVREKYLLFKVKRMFVMERLEIQEKTLFCK